MAKGLTLQVSLQCVALTPRTHGIFATVAGPNFNAAVTFKIQQTGSCANSDFSSYKPLYRGRFLGHCVSTPLPERLWRKVMVPYKQPKLGADGKERKGFIVKQKTYCNFIWQGDKQGWSLPFATLGQAFIQTGRVDYDHGLSPCLSLANLQIDAAGAELALQQQTAMIELLRKVKSPVKAEVRVSVLWRRPPRRVVVT